MSKNRHVTITLILLFFLATCTNNGTEEELYIDLTKNWGLLPRHLSKPSWSPDSSNLLIGVGDSNHQYGPIFITNITGSSSENMISNSGCGMYDSPTWSPQGNVIAFLFRTGTSDCGPDWVDGMYIMELSETESPKSVHLIKKTSPHQNLYGPLSWSPDGQEIFFGVYDNYASTVHSIHFDGSDEREIIQVAPVGSSFEISPDGEKLAFLSGLHDFRRLSVLHLDTGREQILRNQAMVIWAMTWSPDGSRIAFVANNQEGKGELYIINSDGSDVQRLDDDYDYIDVAWSPDGQWLATVAVYVAEDSSSWFELILRKVDF